MKERLGRIIVGHTNAEVKDRKPVYARDLNAHGAMTALLKDALKPNVVQTLENNVMMIHGGPFANIAHGCNSFLATKTALQLVGEDGYVVTEAGFGADLGAEKFIDIKCRTTGLIPSCVVVVCTVKALKHHGGVSADGYKTENLEALKKGFANLDKHLTNVQTHYGLPCVVSINHFYHDTEAEIKMVQDHLNELGVCNVIGKHWAEGGKGAADLAKQVVALSEGSGQKHKYVYEAEDKLFDKISAVAKKIYGAETVKVSDALMRRLDKYTKEFPGFPICMAKTQSSFSDNATLRGAPTGFTLEVTDAVVSNGAGFIVVMCGDIMTMPGLPKVPAAENINVDDKGQISGLF
jgi:formate--tetrahydrofolate ligase